MAQPNGGPTSCTITFLSNTASGYLQATNLLDRVTVPLPPPEVIPDILLGILEPLIGNDPPKAPEVPLDVVKHFDPPGKTLRAESAGDSETGVDGAPEDSSVQAGTSTPSVPGGQDAPVIAPNPPAVCPSRKVVPLLLILHLPCQVVSVQVQVFPGQT